MATAKKVLPVPAGPIPKVIVELSIVSIYLNCETFLTLIDFEPMIDILSVSYTHLTLPTIYSV